MGGLLMASGQSDKFLASVYDPRTVEQKIYELWEHGGYFRPHPESGKTPFSIVMPPPNVTGSLHLGHAWDNTLQDIVIRYKRMAGFDTLWVPGTDHAGIATQTRVEKVLQEQEGLTRHDLGREQFVQRVWAWKQQFGNLITDQIRALGSSCDWSRQRFTMDDGLSKAVREVFVALYEKGLIYRGRRIINWCPRCSTALSDIEVEHLDVTAKLYYVRYPAAVGHDSVVVATTRPETMFADVAVAVHPDDARYAALVGQTLRLPLTDRVIPVIADTYVDADFGTGCLKITPAHDPNDFEVGVRHHLEMPQCIDADGRLNTLAGIYAGLSREQARERVVADLRAQGYLEREAELVHAVGHCSRCNTVVEPFLSTQWFVRMDDLARPALTGVEAQDLSFVPERFRKVFIHWLENVRDWCISRQLWWGHRIPAWYCDDCGQISVSRQDIVACEYCHSLNIHQDEDVLDTWFSSALWPFSTMGWPQQSEDLQRYFPTSALMTGYDILFFWVARMVFMGLEFTGSMPFQQVVLHGLIRAADGKKMSKSLGNGVDPLAVIDKYGADALRFTLATGTTPGNDQRFHWDKVEGSRNFVNKLWNAARFVLLNLPADESLAPLDLSRLLAVDRWILHRLNDTVRTVSDFLDRYDFGEAGRVLYNFAWDDYCDWYIEFSKLTLYGEDLEARAQTQAVLVTVLDNLLRLLHPFIPFVTEEIWRSLPQRKQALIVTQWPEIHSEWVAVEEEKEVVLVQEVVRAGRSIRSELGISPSTEITMEIQTAQINTESVLFRASAYIQRFCRVSDLVIHSQGKVPRRALSAVVSGAQLYVPLAGLVDVETELDRLGKEATRLQGEVQRAENKLANRKFVDKAPPAVVTSERSKLADYREKLERVRLRIEWFQSQQ